MLEAQEQSQARLLKLEAELPKSDKRREMEGTVKQKHKFNPLRAAGEKSRQRGTSSSHGG